MTLRIRLVPHFDRVLSGQGDSIYREETVACS